MNDPIRGSWGVSLTNLTLSHFGSANECSLPGIAIYEVPDDWVALASGTLQPFAIEDAYMAPAVLDQSTLLQAASSQGHAGAASSKHRGQELLRQIEVWALNFVP
jgi:hypothetical protein